MTSKPLAWVCRCVPGISFTLWALLCYHVFASRLLELRTNPEDLGQNETPLREEDAMPLDLWETVYVAYCLITHACACLVFPARLIWSMWHILEEIRLAKYEAVDVVRPYADSEGSSTLEVGSNHDEGNLIETASAGASSASSVTLEGEGSLASSDNGKARWTDGYGETFGGEEVVNVTHAIIIPSYKEDIDTLRETLAVLASHALAKSSYDVYLAMEERDPDAEWTAHALSNSYKASFRNISHTLHPSDISGEVAGKSSNVSWAARQLSNNYTDARTRAGCVITVMDSDTHLSSNYFLLLTKYHREDRDRGNTLYCVPVVFDRNAHKVNSFVRAADIFWCGAGLSGLYNGSSIKIPTSVYSIAMTLAGHVGGWDSGPESIGEDMHMFLKCYFKSKGQVKTKVIYSPASQSNVHSDLGGIRGYIASLHARYQQALRHMWGSLDSGYAIRKGLEAWNGVKDDGNAEWLQSPDPDQRVPRWVADSSLSHFTPPNVYEAPSPRQAPATFSTANLLSLYHRLYEAHFLPAHLTIALISMTTYSLQISPEFTSPSLLWAFDFCGALRFIGFVATNIFLCQYELYHRACVRMREDEMKRAGLYEDMAAQDGFTHRDWRDCWSDYVALPVNGTLFGTLPAVVAGLGFFWTDRIGYRVSSKPRVGTNDGRRAEEGEVRGEGSSGNNGGTRLVDGV